MNNREGLRQLQGFVDGSQLGQGLTHPFRLVTQMDKYETFEPSIREELITTLCFMLAAERFRLLVLEDLSIIIILPKTLRAYKLQELGDHLVEYSELARHAANTAEVMAKVIQKTIPK